MTEDFEREEEEEEEEEEEIRCNEVGSSLLLCVGFYGESDKFQLYGMKKCKGQVDRKI
jgi:hypothetical protein